MSCIRCAVVLLSVIAIAPVAAQQKLAPFDSGEVKGQYPDGWNRTPLAVGIRAAFIDGSEKSFVVTRTRVDFSPKYNEAFAQVEEGSIRAEFPDATELTRSTVTSKAHGPILQIDFTLPGVTSGRNPQRLRVRYAAIPVRTFIYRITCIARESEFKSRYDSAFKTMVETLVLTPPAP